MGSAARDLRVDPPHCDRRLPRVAGRPWAALASVLFAAVFLAGCAAPRTAARPRLQPPRSEEREAFEQARRTLAGQFPPAYHATHRAVIDVGRRHYVCDGFLSTSPTTGLHLAVVSAFGLVTEVRVPTGAAPEVVRTTPLFRESWARDHVSRDLRWLFAAPPELEAAGTLPDGRLVLESGPSAEGVQARYVFAAGGRGWEALELWQAGRRAWQATLLRRRTWDGWPVALPAEIEVDAGAYRLNLRVAEWVGEDPSSVPAAGGPGP
jgi:hypothetical protein